MPKHSARVVTGNASVLVPEQGRSIFLSRLIIGTTSNQCRRSASRHLRAHRFRTLVTRCSAMFTVQLVTACAQQDEAWTGCMEPWTPRAKFSPGARRKPSAGAQFLKLVNQVLLRFRPVQSSSALLSSFFSVFLANDNQVQLITFALTPAVLSDLFQLLPARIQCPIDCN